MLGQRRRQWANIRAALVLRLVSAGWLFSTVNPISGVSYTSNLLFYRPLFQWCANVSNIGPATDKLFHVLIHTHFYIKQLVYYVRLHV